MKSLVILMEAVQWGHNPAGSGFKKSGCKEAEECSRWQRGVQEGC